MLTYDRLRENPAALQAFTGLSTAGYEILLPVFDRAWHAHLEATLTSQPARQRKPGAGRKARLACIEDKLIFILFYFKRAPLQAKLGSHFNLSQGQVSVWTKRLSTVLQAALDQLQPSEASVCSGLQALVSATKPGVTLAQRLPADGPASENHYA